MYTNKEQSLAYAVEHPRQAFNPVSWKGVYDPFDWYATHRDSSNHYLWGNPDFSHIRPLKDMAKTIYDPCPAGYVVAPANAFRDFECPDKMEFTENGFFFNAGDGQKCFFPFAGGEYHGLKLDRINTNGNDSAALWNSSSARFIYWNDGGSRTVVRKNDKEVRLWYGDTRCCGYPVRCVKQAE